MERNHVEKGLTKFVRRQAYHSVMFGWVRALVLNLPSITVDKAVENFVTNNKVNDVQEMNKSSLVREYYRMLTESFGDEATR